MKGRLAIDFGAAATKAATSDGESVELLQLDGGRELPTLVYLSKGYLEGSTKSPPVGRKAASYAGRSTRLVTRLKHQIGADGPIPPRKRTTNVDGHDLLLTDLVAHVLRAVVEDAPGGRTSPTILTHPVGWGKPERALLTAALAQAGRKQAPMFITEPEAAALFAIEQDVVSLADGAVAVFDLGASTFDAAVVAASGSGSKTLAARGRQTGGDDFDAALLDLVTERLREEDDELAGDFERFRDEWAWLVAAEARRIKELLSVEEEATFAVQSEDVSFPDVPLTQEDLYDAIEPLTDECIDTFVDCVTSCPPSTEIANVLLTGGSSQLPLVQELANQVAATHFPDATVQLVATDEVSPGQVVAPGAMIRRNATRAKITGFSARRTRDVGAGAVAVGKNKVVTRSGGRKGGIVDLRNGDKGAQFLTGGEMAVLNVIGGDPKAGTVVTGTDNGCVELWSRDGRLKKTHTPHGTFFGSLRGNGLTAAAVLGDDLAYTFQGKSGRYHIGSDWGTLSTNSPVALGLLKSPKAAVVVENRRVLLRGPGGDADLELEGDDIPYAQHAAFDPRAGRIAIVDDESGLWLVDAARRRLSLRHHRKLAANATAVALVDSSDGALVLVALDDEVCALDLSGTTRHKHTFDEPVTQLSNVGESNRFVAHFGSSAALVTFDWS